jgi:hypothetical protein
MERLGKVFEWSVPNGFSRFPLIESDLNKVPKALIDEIAQPMLEGIFNYLSQSHFNVIHEFVCPIRGVRGYNCKYVHFAEAQIRNILEEIRVKIGPRLLHEVSLLLPQWTYSMREPEEITEERDELRKKLKSMHAFYVGYSIDDARGI